MEIWSHKNCAIWTIGNFAKEGKSLEIKMGNRQRPSQNTSISAQKIAKLINISCTLIFPVLQHSFQFAIKSWLRYVLHNGIKSF